MGGQRLDICQDESTLKPTVVTPSVVTPTVVAPVVGRELTGTEKTQLKSYRLNPPSSASAKANFERLKALEAAASKK